MFRDFALLLDTAEAISLTDVTQSVFVVVYGHFGLDTIYIFPFLVFPCWGLLWWHTFLLLLSVFTFSLSLWYPTFLRFFISSFSPILQSLSPSCIAILFHLSLVFPFPAPPFVSFCFHIYSAIPNCYIPYHFFISSTVTLVCPIPNTGFMILLSSSPGSNFTLQQPDWLFYLPENQSPPTPSSVQ